jgi:hypothetical protein
MKMKVKLAKYGSFAVILVFRNGQEKIYIYGL